MKTNQCLSPMLLFSASLLLLVSGAAAVTIEHANDDLSVLLLGGSSSSSGSSVPRFDEMVQAMMTELANGGPETAITSAITSPDQSANLTELELENSAELFDRLHERQWSFVALQENREVPGYVPPDDNDSREDMWAISTDTILRLSAEIQNQGATTVLLQTPAYMDGADNYNSDLYTSFATMQGYVNHGYKIWYQEILEQNARAQIKIAPCGMAFEGIYNDLRKPLEKDSLFTRLYEEDGQSLSFLGTYVCASVLVQTLTGRDVRPLSYMPPGVDVLERKIILATAYRTVNQFEHPPKPTKGYSPESKRHSVSSVNIMNFIFAFVLGGGVLYGWIAWKWQGVGETIHDMTEQGSYQLLPSSGMFMELTGQEPENNEPQWINPV